MMPIKPTPRTRGIRYVDVRLAIPDDSPYPSAGEVVGYLQQQPQPRSALSLSGDDDSTNANNSDNNGRIHSNYYKAPTFDSTTRRHQPAPSSFTFIPLGPSTEDGDGRATPATIKGPTAPVFSDNRKTSISHGPNSSRNLQLHQQQQAGVVFSPPPILSTSPSPFEFDSALDYFRKAAPSPAMTATTMDSSEDFSIGFDARSYRTRATPSPSSGSRSRRSFVASPSTAMMWASTSSTMGGFVSPLAIPPTLVEEESTKINVCLSPPSNAIKDKAGRCGATPSPTGSPEYPTPRKSLDFRLAVSPSPIPSAMTTAPPKTCATGSTATSVVLSASTSSSTSANNNAVAGTSTTTTNKKKSPFARDDDSVRKSRIKTELCMHYVRGNPCPFGTGCTYAHGEEELQMTKLMDLHRAGLIDVETYRTKPCLTWISTGSWYVCNLFCPLSCSYNFIYQRIHSSIQCDSHTILLYTIPPQSQYIQMTVPSENVVPVSTTSVRQASMRRGSLIPKRKAIPLRRISMSMVSTKSDSSVSCMTTPLEANSRLPLTIGNLCTSLYPTRRRRTDVVEAPSQPFTKRGSHYKCRVLLTGPTSFARNI